MRGIISFLFLEVAGALLVISVLMLPKKEFALSRLALLVRGIFWLPTILSWIIQRKRDELGRFLIYLWPFLSTLWLWKWIYDQIVRLHLQPETADKAFLVVLYVTMAFLSFCIEVWRYSEKSLIRRVLFWFKTMPGWFTQGKLFLPILYSTMVWGLVATSWFSGICLDLGGLFYDIYMRILAA